MTPEPTPEHAPSRPLGASRDVVDSLDMCGAAIGMPNQIAAALDLATSIEALPVHAPVTNVVVLGMGGSGIAGDVLSVVAGPRMAVPVIQVKSAALPAFVGPDSLVFAVSCSGETAETLTAVTSAFEAGATVVGITGGGTLGDLVASRTMVVIDVPSTIPQPRAGLAAMTVPPLVVLERLGLLDGIVVELDACVSALSRRVDLLTGDSGEAAEVARRIGRTIPLVYGAFGPASVAAQRWKTQVNENAKTPAFFSQLPELCHNEIAGWGQHGDVTRQVFTLLTLRHEDEQSDIVRRFAFMEDVMLEVVADIIEVRTSERSTVGRFFDLAMIGDFVSLALAANEGVDPGPVPVLGDLKAAVAAR